LATCSSRPDPVSRSTAQATWASSNCSASVMCRGYVGLRDGSGAGPGSCLSRGETRPSTLEGPRRREHVREPVRRPAPPQRPAHA
jgi:hypothetical protein